uniref:Uncharacterized protein n=1 Tax=Salix viminalis TaxID=40686 RepID=A0A6N2MBS9_SALVM
MAYFYRLAELDSVFLAAVELFCSPFESLSMWPAVSEKCWHNLSIGIAKMVGGDSYIHPRNEVRSKVTMETKKERIEALEAGLRGVQDGMQQLELGVTHKLHHLEETINKLSKLLLSTREVPSNNPQEGSLHSMREGNNANLLIHNGKTGISKIFWRRSNRMA